ncbi:hypothetical protein ABPG74_021000 [Tetrahymena malaccensis]
MADKEEITLDAYAKKQKSSEGGNKKKENGKGGKGRIEKKLNGIKSAKGAIRRTGRNDNNRSGGKPRQNSSNNSNKQRSTSRPIKESRPTKIKTVRPIPEHKKRIVKVYNLVPTINNEEFYNLFVKYGSIEQSKIETDKKGKSEEKGYVVYRDNDAAKRAIDDLNGVELEGRIITVEFMKDGDKLPDRSNNNASSGERERRNSDGHSQGVQKKRIFKDKDNRRDSRRDRDRNSNNGNKRRDFDRNRRNNGSHNNNGNRNRNRNNNNNNRNNNRNNRKYSK